MQKVYHGIFLGCVGLFLFAPVAVAFTQDVVITEVMYDLKDSDSDREWLELYNAGSEAVTIKGGTSGQDSWRIYHKTSGGVESNKTVATDAFQGTMTLGSGDYAVVVQNGAGFKNDHPNYTGNIFVASAMSFANTSMTLGLRLGSAGTPWSLVEYSSLIGANGDGNSLQKSGSTWLPLAPTPGAAAPSSGTPPPSAPVPDGDTSAATSTEESAPGVSPVGTPASSEQAWTPEPQHVFPSMKFAKQGVAGADISFEASALGDKKQPLENARFMWSFGDGGVGEGKKVRHVYHFPASYVVMVEASSGAWSNTARGDISISPTQLMIAKVVAGPEGVVEISNGGSIDVDLSSWLLQSNGTFFVFPAHTFLSAKRSVPFPSAVTNFLADPNDTVLLYPNGRRAVRFSPSDSVVPTPVLALTVTPAVTSSEQTVLEPEPPKAVAKESEVIQKKETFPEKKTETVASSTPAGTLAAAALMSVDSQTKPPRTSLWFGSALALAILGAGGFLFMHGTNPSGFVPEAIEEEKGGRALSADDFDIIED